MHIHTQRMSLTDLARLSLSLASVRVWLCETTLAYTIYAVVVITNCVGHACWKIARQHVPHKHHKLFANSIALVYCVTLYLQSTLCPRFYRTLECNYLLTN